MLPSRSLSRGRLSSVTLLTLSSADHCLLPCSVPLSCPGGTLYLRIDRQQRTISAGVWMWRQAGVQGRGQGRRHMRCD